MISYLLLTDRFQELHFTQDCTTVNVACQSPGSTDTSSNNTSEESALSLLASLTSCFQIIGFVKAKKNLEIRANFQIVFKMFERRVASLVNVICKPKLFVQSAKWPRYEFVTQDSCQEL